MYLIVYINVVLYLQSAMVKCYALWSTSLYANKGGVLIRFPVDAKRYVSDM
jgi:hypothetical protein